jgi:hypothetical protein
MNPTSSTSPSDLGHRQLAQLIIESRPGSPQSTAAITELINRNRRLKSEIQALLPVEIETSLNRRFTPVNAQNNRMVPNKTSGQFMHRSNAVAFLLIGIIVIGIAAAGVIPIGNPQPVINGPMLRLFLFSLGLVPFSLGSIMGLKEIISPPVRMRQQVLEPDLERFGASDVRSVFSERLEHFHDEKEYLAKRFVPVLLDRCKFYAEKGQPYTHS